MGTVRVAIASPKTYTYVFSNYCSSSDYSNGTSSYVQFDIDTSGTLSTLDAVWNRFVKKSGRMPLTLLVSPRFYHRCIEVMEADRRYDTLYSKDLGYDKTLTYRGARCIVVADALFDIPRAVGAQQDELKEWDYWGPKSKMDDATEVRTVGWGI